MQVNVTDADRETIRKSIERARLTESDWLYEAIFEKLEREKKQRAVKKAAASK